MYDVIIIGSGPAAYTAAIYSARAFLKTLIVSGIQPGGQLTTTTEIENFPGFPEGIMGPQLMENMRKQAEKFGSTITTDVVSTVKFDAIGKIFTVAGNQEYQGRSVIVATGASAKSLGIPTEERFRGKGVSYCATCDGFFFRDKHIAVLGGGDTAMEEATFLTKFASSVTIIHRREEFRASPIMVEKAKKNPKIRFLLNKEVVEFTGEETIKTIKLKDTKTGQTEDFPTEGVFVAIGHTPSTDFLKDVIELDEKGYIITFNRLAEDYFRGIREVSSEKFQKIKTAPSLFSTHTSVRGIFAAGDCVDSRYRQAVVAAGMGCMAAIDVEKYLAS